MIREVKFSEVTNFTGRNDYMKCSGVELIKYSLSENILITPLTSRGQPGRCDISVPVKDIPELIRVLKEVTGKQTPNKQSLLDRTMEKWDVPQTQEG